MRQGRIGRVASVIVLLLLSSGATASVSSEQSAASIRAFATPSWAIGIVIPEGAPLQDGGRLRWEGVTNVTAMMTLPNITLPDRVVYAVLSLMTSDGTVLQAAVGIYPNGNCWLAYAWSIQDVESPTPAYRWILNSSQPRMTADDRVSISIFRASDAWYLSVLDKDTGSSVRNSFPQGIASDLKVGDQEAFAVESYSRTGSTFQNMGNLTLWSLTIDGEKVTGGVYSYGDWDPTHSPVFVVGSSGTSPPTFMSLEQLGDGSFQWGYLSDWGTKAGVLQKAFETGLATMLLVSFATLTVGVWLARGRMRRLSNPDRRIREPAHGFGPAP